MAVTRRIDDFLKQRPASFKIWLRGVVLQQLIDFRRAHMDAQKRSVHREVDFSSASSLSIAQTLLTDGPSAQAQKKEEAEMVRVAIDGPRYAGYNSILRQPGPIVKARESLVGRGAGGGLENGRPSAKSLVNL